MIYDVTNLPARRRFCIGLVKPEEIPAQKALTYECIPLLNVATSIFRRHDDERSGTKMIIHRVERLQPDDEATIGLLRAQGLAREVEAFLAQDQTKLLLWGRFVPEDAPPVTRDKTFADDLVIGPNVGLTRDQLKEWYFSANLCKQATCGLKLLLDSLLARGDTIVLNNWFPNLTTQHILTKVERVQMPAALPLQGFYLVDPALQPEYAHVRHDGAFPVYHQGIGTDDHIPHDVLALVGRPRSGKGPEIRVHVDPTYRQVMPSVDLPADFRCYPMGPEGVSPEYCSRGTRAHVLHDEEPFTADRIELVTKGIYPDNSQFTDKQEAINEIGNTMVSLLGALAEVMGIR